MSSQTDDLKNKKNTTINHNNMKKQNMTIDAKTMQSAEKLKINGVGL